MSYVPVRSFLQARDPSVDRRFRPRPFRQVNLINLITEDEDDSNSWTDTNSENESEYPESVFSVENNCVQHECALVYLRLRPIQNQEKVLSSYTPEGNVLVTKNNSDKGSKGLIEKHFTFTDIIDGTMKQSSVYDTCIKRSIEIEENLTVLTYGTSGSGKTYTQIGNVENPGLIPRAIEHLFAYYGGSVQDIPYIKVVNASISFLEDAAVEDNLNLRRKMLTADNKELYNHDQLRSLVRNEHKFEATDIQGKSVFVWISFAEIYNEMVYDLLNPNYEQQVSKKKGLTIVSNKGRVFIKDLTSVLVQNSFEAHLLLKTGTQRITFGSTAVNNHSSRSHFVFFIDVITRVSNVVAFHSYKFCDLAGSERLDKTKNVGNRLKEAQRINTSLLVLGRCLDVVYHNQLKKQPDMVPFRDSKLTTLLQIPLMGKEKMTMIVNINPSDEYFEENLHVLSFASIAKNIVFKQKPKKEVKKSRYSWLAANPSFNALHAHYAMLQDDNKILRNEFETLTAKKQQLERAFTIQEMELRKSLICEYEVRMQRQGENWKTRMDHQKNYYEERVRQLEYQLKAKSGINCSPTYISDSGTDSNLEVFDSDSN